MSTAVQHASSGDVRIAYEVAGDGPPLLLVMGLGYDRHGWGVVPRLLADDFTVAWYDNRGLGESDVPTGPYSASLMAGDALAVMDAAGFGRAHVVGTSLGGMVAQELVLAHPERVDRLIVCCSSPHMPPPSLWQQRAAAVSEAGSVAAIADAVVERWLTPDYAQRNPDVRGRLRAMSLTPSET